MMCVSSSPTIFNLPTVAYSGEIDNQKQAADVMAREMKKVGLELTHIIGPKTGHSYEKAAKVEVNERIDAIVEKVRERMPNEFKFTTYTLRYNRCGPIILQKLQRHWERADVTMKQNAQGIYDILTRGLTQFALTLPTPATVRIDGGNIITHERPGKKDQMLTFVNSTV